MIQIHLKSKTNFYQAKSKQNLFSHQLNPVRLGDTEIVVGIWKIVLGQSNIISCRAVRFGYGRKPQIGKREQPMHVRCMPAFVSIDLVARSIPMHNHYGEFDIGICAVLKWFWRANPFESSFTLFPSIRALCRRAFRCQAFHIITINGIRT